MRVKTVAYLNIFVGLVTTILGIVIETGFLSNHEHAHIWGPTTVLFVGIVGLCQSEGEGKEFPRLFETLMQMWNQSLILYGDWAFLGVFLDKTS